MQGPHPVCKLSPATPTSAVVWQAPRAHSIPKNHRYDTSLALRLVFGIVQHTMLAVCQKQSGAAQAAMTNMQSGALWPPFQFPVCWLCHPEPLLCMQINGRQEDERLQDWAGALCQAVLAGHRCTCHNSCMAALGGGVHTFMHNNAFATAGGQTEALSRGGVQMAAHKLAQHNGRKPIWTESATLPIPSA